MTIDELVKNHVLKTLSESATKVEAAKKLGICIRTLRNYLHLWGRHDLIGESPGYRRDLKYNTVTAKQRDDYYNWNGR